jgi:hypothetical protein
VRRSALRRRGPGSEKRDRIPYGEARYSVTEHPTLSQILAGIAACLEQLDLWLRRARILRFALPDFFEQLRKAPRGQDHGVREDEAGAARGGRPVNVTRCTAEHRKVNA